MEFMRSAALSLDGLQGRRLLRLLPFTLTEYSTTEEERVNDCIDRELSKFQQTLTPLADAKSNLLPGACAGDIPR